MPTRLIVAAGALTAALVAAPAPPTAVDHAEHPDPPATVSVHAQRLPEIPPPDVSHDHRPCVTHGEWRLLETLMRPATVAALFDTDGRRLGHSRNVFRRGYRLCWKGGLGVVRYDRQSGLSVSWKVRDR